MITHLSLGLIISLQFGIQCHKTQLIRFARCGASNQATFSFLGRELQICKSVTINNNYSNNNYNNNNNNSNNNNNNNNNNSNNNNNNSCFTVHKHAVERNHTVNM